MNKPKWLALLTFAITAAAVVAWFAPTGPRSGPPQAAPARVAPSAGAEQFLHTHAALLKEAAALERPGVLPALVGVDGELAQPPPTAGATSVLPPVPPEAQVHLAFTSSAMGEIDPCG